MIMETEAALLLTPWDSEIRAMKANLNAVTPTAMRSLHVSEFDGKESPVIGE